MREKPRHVTVEAIVMKGEGEEMWKMKRGCTVLAP